VPARAARRPDADLARRRGRQHRIPKKSWFLLGATSCLGLTSVVDLFLCARMGSVAAMQPVVPAVQKVVLMLAIGWMLVAAAVISRAARSAAAREHSASQV